MAIDPISFEQFKPSTLKSRLYELESDATWICERCGIIKPYWSTCLKQYVKQRCKCPPIVICKTCGNMNPRWDEKKQEYISNPCICEIRQEREALHRAQQKKIEQQNALTFSWLGIHTFYPIEKTFQSFDTTTPLAHIALTSVQDFIQKKEGTLILEGSNGTGKTHLLVAMCNEIKQESTSWLAACRFCTSPDLFQSLQKRIANGQEYDFLIERAITTPLLVIDDIDKAKWSEFREEIYFRIVNGRVNRGLPLAISTNKFDVLDQYVGAAVHSRLYVKRTVVSMYGEDYRKGMNQHE